MTGSKLSNYIKVVSVCFVYFKMCNVSAAMDIDNDHIDHGHSLTSNSQDYQQGMKKTTEETFIMPVVVIFLLLSELFPKDFGMSLVLFF